MLGSLYHARIKKEVKPLGVRKCEPSTLSFAALESGGGINTVFTHDVFPVSSRLIRKPEVSDRLTSISFTRIL